MGSGMRIHRASPSHPVFPPDKSTNFVCDMALQNKDFLLHTSGDMAVPWLWQGVGLPPDIVPVVQHDQGWLIRPMQQRDADAGCDAKWKLVRLRVRAGMRARASALARMRAFARSHDRAGARAPTPRRAQARKRASAPLEHERTPGLTSGVLSSRFGRKYRGGRRQGRRWAGDRLGARGRAEGSRAEGGTAEGGRPRVRG